MKKLYSSTRTGALGALMDLYEQEVALLFQCMDEKVKDEQWATIVDSETEDEDCRSIQTICQHIVGAAEYYINLLKQGDDPNFKIPKRSTIQLPTKADFKAQLQQTMQKQDSHFENRWDLSDDEIEKIKINAWGTVMEPDFIMEHAVMHIMRHHRQILKFIEKA